MVQPIWKTMTNSSTFIKYLETSTGTFMCDNQCCFEKGGGSENPKSIVSITFLPLYTNNVTRLSWTNDKYWQNTTMKISMKTRTIRIDTSTLVIIPICHIYPSCIAKRDSQVFPNPLWGTWLRKNYCCWLNVETLHGVVGEFALTLVLRPTPACANASMCWHCEWWWVE